jgi:hypothetical protein
MGGIAPITTYQTATINPGQRRRRATTAQKNAADSAAFLSASITIHPGGKSHTWCKRRSASRRSHRCRVRQPLPATHVNHAQRPVPHVTITSHIASFATQIAAITSAIQSAHTVSDAVTGESYEHAQLIQGPNADEWLYSTAHECGLLTKGVAPHMPSGSKTMLPSATAWTSRNICSLRRHGASPQSRKQASSTHGGQKSCALSQQS